MPLILTREDITALPVEAVVNPANRNLRRTNGICGTVFAKAGAAELREACDKIGSCPVGGAVITPAFKLAAKNIIHAVGPVWINGFQHEPEQLTACYQSALKLVVQNKIQSVAFPLISFGLYGYPKEKAFQIAYKVLSSFLEAHDTLVYLSVYDPRAAMPDPAVCQSLAAHIAARGRSSDEPTDEVELPSLDDMLFEPFEEEKPAVQPEDIPFFSRVTALAKERGLSEKALCRAANMTVSAFSRLRNHPNALPDRRAALALCVALRLTPDEARELLQSAGLFFLPDDRRDLTVDFFLRRGGSLAEVNAALYSLGEEPLFTL